MKTSVMTLLAPTLAPLLASGLLLAGSVSPSSAQTPSNLTELAPTAWLLSGTNGNVVIVADEQGLLFVDDERAAAVPEMLTAGRVISPGPVRMVINTHWHLDHSGGNAALAGAGAVVVAHRNVRARLAADQFMAAYNRTIPASPDIALPAVVFDDAMTIHFGDEILQLKHTPAAHTDGDSLVYLEKANVLHMGDVFFNGLFPFIDRSSGGSIQGLLASVDTALALSDEQTRIVPAHGAVTDRAGLSAYRAMLIAVRDKVQAGIAAGDTRDAVIQSRPAAAWTLGGDADGFVAAIYDSLSPQA